MSPSNVVSVDVDEEEKSARVVVPDYQLSLAIGKEGQNARLAARLTGFKIDIKSETQAKEMGPGLSRWAYSTVMLRLLLMRKRMQKMQSRKQQKSQLRMTTRKKTTNSKKGFPEDEE